MKKKENFLKCERRWENKMFGKNYDAEIIELNKQIVRLTEEQKKIIELLKEQGEYAHKAITDFQLSLIEIAKVQQSHKKAIMLLSGRE